MCTRFFCSPAVLEDSARFVLAIRPKVEMQQRYLISLQGIELQKLLSGPSGLCVVVAVEETAHDAREIGLNRARVDDDFIMAFDAAQRLRLQCLLQVLRRERAVPAPAGNVMALAMTWRAAASTARIEGGCFG